MTKLKILIVLIAIGGIALFQVGNVCTAENVIQDTTIQVPAHEYCEVYAIGRIYTSQVDRYTEYGPVYKVLVEAWDSDEDQYKPIDLLILDSVAYRKFQKGEKFEYWGQLNMINGTYYFHHPGVYDILGFPYRVILRNRSEQPLYVHVRIAQVR